MVSESRGLDEYGEIVKTLSESELEWRELQPFLESRGYALRTRYHPNWKPSWEDGRIQARDAEDGVLLPPRLSQIDATRATDGRLVYIKRVASSSEELRIALLFSEESRKDDPRNHGVPVLDVLEDPHDANISYSVMPLLHRLNEPPFADVSDAIDFVTQMLEGLVYMHEMNIAHRDCTYNNILMDASGIYPEGFHPVKSTFSPDLSRVAKTIPRREARRPVTYYFIDFGISSYIPSDQPRLVLGLDGIDDKVPELSRTVPYDPFKVDIFILGHVFQREICARFSNFEPIRPLIDAMMSRDPGARPDAAAALQQWRDIRRNFSYIHRQWRLRHRTETRTGVVTSDAAYLVERGAWLVKRGVLLLRRPFR